MVHSGSASPMTTTPSTSTHLTGPATAPLLQVAPPLVPPPGDTTVQELSQPPALLLSTDSFSDPDSTPSPVDAEPPVLTPAAFLTTNSNPASPWSSAQTPTPSLGPVNGRTSGRKRTPKACDCCGPNSTAHHVQTSGRGKGKNKGKGKGVIKDVGDTPKGKVDELTHINNFDLTKEMVEEAEDENNIHKKVQTTVVLAGAQAHTPAPLPFTFLQGGPKRNSAAPDEDRRPKNEGILLPRSLLTGGGGKGGLHGSAAEMSLSDVAGRGVSVLGGSGGREIMGASFASKIKVEVGMKRQGGTCLVVGSKMDLPAQSVVVQCQEENKHAQLEIGEQTNYCAVKSPFGDTVNLSDSEPEVETKDDIMIRPELGNGMLSITQESVPVPRSGTPQDTDSEMQVDKTVGRTHPGSSSETLSNGNATTPTDHDHRSIPMEVEVSQPNLGSITLYRRQHHWALKDHGLYCRPGTWEKGEKEDQSGEGQSEEAEMDGKMQSEDRREQLTDMVHEFLESFYLKYGSFTPLCETDVLEHLKRNCNSDLSKCGLDIKREMTRYRSGLASAPLACFMLMHNKHTLGLEDLGTLEEQNWLNDQIINMYGELIMEETQHKVHFFNSFFHKQLVAKGYDGVKRWTKKVDLFSKWLLLIPIHLEIHWSLVTVTMATKTISYYDSQGIVFRHTTDNIMKYLQSEAREKEQTAFQKGWKITIIKGIPQQKNDSDCGVFVLEYCRRLSVKQPLLFCQEDMPHIRKRIYKELCDCRLNDLSTQ